MFSRTDLAAIYRACELESFEWYLYDNQLLGEIIGFYGHDCWGNWSEDLKTRQNERIMALLFFAAAGGEL